MAIRHRGIYHIKTGGTIGSGKSGEGARGVDLDAQKGTLSLLNKVPFTKYDSLSVEMSGDSSAHPREHFLDLGRVALDHVDQPTIIEFGSDTMNLAASTLALMGNEMWKLPMVFLGSIKGPEKENSDAHYNTFTAGLFAAFADASGVFAVRPNGVVITSRHDTPGGSVDWHGRGLPQAEHAYFARVSLDKFVDEDLKIIFDLSRGKKGRSISQELEKLIVYQRPVPRDGTLDHGDQIVVGGRGRLPGMSVVGYGRKTLVDLKDRPEDDNPEKIRKDILALIENKRKEGRVVGNVLPAIALVEHIKRDRSRHKNFSSRDLHEKWAEVFEDFMAVNLGVMRDTSRSIVEFWEKYSGVKNDSMDFNGLVDFSVNSDPDYFLRAFQLTSPKGVILKATGAAGMRLREDFAETYEPLLGFCKKSRIPVVLTASSRGEVTSFEYPPGLELLKKDLCFFSGTMDLDLVYPRMALLNSGENQGFMQDLLSLLDVSITQKNVIGRNMYRQLLSGAHYRKSEEGEIPDRKRAEDIYGIETRVDLLSDVHAKKAIFASYLHEINMRGLEVPNGLGTFLNTI